MELPEHMKEFILKHWRPNQDDSFIKVVKNSEDDFTLKKWFDQLDEIDKTPDIINVGPYIGICPYGRFEINNETIEYLFIYETIDPKQLNKNQLKI